MARNLRVIKCLGQTTNSATCSEARDGVETELLCVMPYAGCMSIGGGYRRKDYLPVSIVDRDHRSHCDVYCRLLRKNHGSKQRMYALAVGGSESGRGKETMSRQNVKGVGQGGASRLPRLGGARSCK